MSYSPADGDIEWVRRYSSATRLKCVRTFANTPKTNRQSLRNCGLISRRVCFTALYPSPGSECCEQRHRAVYVIASNTLITIQVSLYFVISALLVDINNGHVTYQLRIRTSEVFGSDAVPALRTDRSIDSTGSLLQSLLIATRRKSGATHCSENR